jgi:membrane protease YdiL (CAAX protease family)
MPAYFKVLIFLFSALFAGALVAPPVFWAGQQLATWGVSDWLAGFPFHRVLSRCVQISFLVLLWPALRWIGLRRPSDLGLQRNPVALRDALAGVILASLCVALVAATGWFLGFSVLRPEPNVGALGKIFLTAGAVSVIEEVVFRGIILGICLWNLSARAAVFASSLLFAVVHFLRPAKTGLSADAVNWWSGFSELLSFAGNLPVFVVLLFGFASLLVAGWILGDSTVRTRSLWLGIGLHAGWILGVQSGNLFLKPSVAEAASLLPWVGPSLVSGSVPTGLLPLAGLLLAGWLARLYLLYVFRPAVPRPL